MKTRSQIKNKLKQVAFRHRQKYVRMGMSTRPCNCVHNEVVELRTPGKLHVIRKCSFSGPEASLDKRICDESFGGLKQAQECPYFTQKNTPEALKRDFDSSLGIDGSQVSSSFLAHSYPDIMALYWVLNSSVEEDSKAFPLEESENSEFLVFMSDFLEDE